MANRTGKQGVARQKGVAHQKGVVRQFAQAGHAGKAKSPYQLKRGNLAVVFTRQKAMLSALTRMDVATQTELPRKHAAVQVSGCRACQSLSLLTDGSQEDSCVRCDQVPLYNRYEALEVEDQSMDDGDDSPSKTEVLPRSEKHTFHINTTSARKRRRVIVVGDSLLRGTEGPICRMDPPLREACCLPGAWVKDITRILPNLVQPSDYYPLLLFHVGGDEAATQSPRAIKRDFRALGQLVRDSGAQMGHGWEKKKKIEPIYGRRIHSSGISWQPVFANHPLSALSVTYILTVLVNMAIIALVWVYQLLQTPMYCFLGNLSFLEIWYTKVCVPKALGVFLGKSQTTSFISYTL
ncbi:hypothetical protein QYF61_005822 [Mycteria americana]|uniref:Uncharacterized protein n=1 Tax=Mycteria americana TaxID=33587 RepID=A0AAN7RMB8_MYCAM|nr:hypothetical protein QYF61_005822 [Mycteria americana]